MFKPFLPSLEKLESLGQRLMNQYFYLDDKDRNSQGISDILSYISYKDSTKLVYEIGDYGGILGFINIVPGEKCYLILRLWNRRYWRPSAVKEAKSLISQIMKKFNLKQIETESADPRIVKMAKIVGFKVKDKQKNGFKWDGEFYDNFLMSINL